MSKAKRMKKRISVLECKPRVRIEWNTGTRVILSRKDKQKIRRNLKAQLRHEMAKI